MGPAKQRLLARLDSLEPDHDVLQAKRLVELSDVESYHEELAMMLLNCARPEAIRIVALITAAQGAGGADGSTNGTL